MKTNKKPFLEKFIPLLIGLIVLSFFIFFMEGRNRKEQSQTWVKSGQETKTQYISQMDTFELIEYGMYEELNIFLSNFSETGQEKIGSDSPTGDLLYFASGHVRLNYKDQSEFSGATEGYLSRHFNKDSLKNVIDYYVRVKIENREDYYSLVTSGDYKEEEKRNPEDFSAVKSPEKYYFVGENSENYQSTFVLVDQVKRLEGDIIQVEFSNYSNEDRKYDPSPSTGIYKLLPEDAKKIFNKVGQGQARVKMKNNQEPYKLISYKAEIE